MSREADKGAQLDLQVNLLVEKEATMLLRMLHEISHKLGMTGRTTPDGLLKTCRTCQKKQGLTNLPKSWMALCLPNSSLVY
jgi:uncharacterized membrane protein